MRREVKVEVVVVVERSRLVEVWDAVMMNAYWCLEAKFRRAELFGSDLPTSLLHSTLPIILSAAR
jgi:hypothetical protein